MQLQQETPKKQEQKEKKCCVSSTQTYTNISRMGMARTSTLSLTKYQTMTFIRKGSDSYRLVYKIDEVAEKSPQQQLKVTRQ
jgi:hypothetical protein